MPLSAARERLARVDVKQALTSFVRQARNHLTACTPVSLLSPSSQTTDDDDQRPVDGPSVPSPAKNAPEAACRPGALVEKPLSVGQEVIRGPNWAWGDQDGFEEGERVAAIGVVVEVRSNGWCKVRWRRTSMLETYRAGIDVVPYSEAAWLQEHPVPHLPTAMSPHPAQGHEEKKDGELGIGAAGGVAPAAGGCNEHEMHGNREAERWEPPASCNEGQTLQCNADEAQRGISARAQGDRDADRSAETGGEQEEAAAEPPYATKGAAESGTCGQQSKQSSTPPPPPPAAPASRFSSILAMGKSAASKAASAMREEAALLSKDFKQMSDDAGRMTAGTLLLAPPPPPPPVVAARCALLARPCLSVISTMRWR